MGSVAAVCAQHPLGVPASDLSPRYSCGTSIRGPLRAETAPTGNGRLPSHLRRSQCSPQRQLYVDSCRFCNAALRRLFFLCSRLRYHFSMSDDPIPLCPATAENVADPLPFALRFQGCKRVHTADELCVGDRRQAAGAGFVVIKRPPIGGAAALGRGHKGR